MSKSIFTHTGVYVRVDTDLTVHSVKLVVEGHGEIGGGAGGYMCNKGGLALIDGVVHVYPTLANLHVLEAGFDAAGIEEDKVNDAHHKTIQHFPYGDTALLVYI